MPRTNVQFATSLLALDYTNFLFVLVIALLFFSYIFRSPSGKLFYHIKIGKNYIFQSRILKNYSLICNSTAFM